MGDSSSSWCKSRTARSASPSFTTKERLISEAPNEIIRMLIMPHCPEDAPGHFLLVQKIPADHADYCQVSVNLYLREALQLSSDGVQVLNIFDSQRDGDL